MSAPQDRLVNYKQTHTKLWAIIHFLSYDFNSFTMIYLMVSFLNIYFFLHIFLKIVKFFLLRLFVLLFRLFICVLWLCFNIKVALCSRQIFMLILFQGLFWNLFHFVIAHNSSRKPEKITNDDNNYESDLSVGKAIAIAFDLVSFHFLLIVMCFWIAHSVNSMAYNYNCQNHFCFEFIILVKSGRSKI